MNPELWMGGAFFAGIIASCWGRVKDIFSRIVGLMIIRAKITDDASVALAYYCWTKMKRYNTGEKSFTSIEEFVRPLKRYQIVGMEKIGRQATVFWRGWRPLTLGFEGGDTNKGETWGLSLSFIRGTFNLDDLITEAIDCLNEWRHKGGDTSRFRVERKSGMGSMRGRSSGKNSNHSDFPENYKGQKFDPDVRLLKWKLGELGADDGSGNPWGALAFPKGVWSLYEECKRWIKSEDWYRKKMIPWRRGFLLYGKPGTGKTSLVRAIAQDLDLPVCYFDLASMSNGEFITSWRELMNTVPCIALLEDVDVVFQGRENRLGEDGGGLTFDCLLNCLSGIEQSDGVLVFVTTNRIEDLDPALGVSEEWDSEMSTRPGRIDRAIELKELDEECRRNIAERIFSDYPDMVDELVEKGNGDTGAQFIDRCSQLALKRFWSEEK